VKHLVYPQHCETKASAEDVDKEQNICHLAEEECQQCTQPIRSNDSLYNFTKAAAVLPVSVCKTVSLLHFSLLPAHMP
jgi:hypothetical protein